MFNWRPGPNQPPDDPGGGLREDAEDHVCDGCEVSGAGFDELAMETFSDARIRPAHLASEKRKHKSGLLISYRSA